MVRERCAYSLYVGDFQVCCASTSHPRPDASGGMNVNIFILVAEHNVQPSCIIKNTKKEIMVKY